MATFVQKVWAEYPIPFAVSIWGETALENLSVLIESSVEELESDVYVIDSLEARGDRTQMPQNCREILTVKLNLGFQGNRYVRKTYDSNTKILYLRMYPASVTYRRSVTVQDLDSLKGDILIYVKSYILIKMAEKEKMILESVKYETDNGEINLSGLSALSQRCAEKLKDLKPDIIMYGNSR